MNRLVHLPARILMLVLVALPMALYGLYLGLIAADRYVSESVVAVRQAGGDNSSLPGAALLLAGINPPSQEDTLFLKEFVHSRALLATLDKRLAVREHFGKSGADWPYRLRADASREDFIEYWRSRVELRFDDRSALLTVRVQGFDATYAQQLNQAILEECERFVNENSHRIARERLHFAEGELGMAGKRLQDSKNQLMAFQQKHRLLDPTAQAQASGMLTNELQASRSRLEAELNGMLSFLNEDAYQVQALKSRLAALDRQIGTERDRATTDTKRGERLNALAIDFQALQLQTQFAQDAYKLALAAVENARIDATRKIKSLLVVEPPSLADTAEYPLRAYNLGTLLALCVLLYAIIRLVLATIREHQD